MGTYVRNNLIAAEQIVYQTKVHPIVFASPALFVMAGIVFGILGMAPAGAAFLAIGAVLFMAAWIRQWSSEFAVTDKRVIIKVGFISRRTIEINMSKVESVEINQDLFGRLLNYGTIIVIGTGGTKEPFALICDPLAFRRAVQSQQG
jgi:uncharacterized membrane protein YdbT with pleckstrin-like domain